MIEEKDTKLTAEVVEYSAGIVRVLAASGVATRDDVDAANDWLKEVKAKKKILEEREKEITAPLNAALKSVRDLFRRPKESLASAEQALKAGIDTFVQLQERSRAEAVQAASKAFASGDTATGAAAIQHVAALDVTPPEGFSVRESWDFVIEAPDLVPRELCTPDATRIRAKLKLVSTKSPAPVIPGVSIFVKRTGVSRA